MYYYVRQIRKIENALKTLGDQRGSVTQHPIKNFREGILEFERRWHKKYGDTPSRSGLMLAVWSFTERPSLAEAVIYAKNNRPDKVYVNLAEQWDPAAFILHDDQEFEFSQYE